MDTFTLGILIAAFVAFTAALPWYAGYRQREKGIETLIDFLKALCATVIVFTVILFFINEPFTWVGLAVTVAVIVPVFAWFLAFVLIGFYFRPRMLWEQFCIAAGWK